MNPGWIAVGALALAHLSGDHGFEHVPPPKERMGGYGATWAATLPSGLQAFLTPHGLSRPALEDLALHRRHGQDPYGMGRAIPAGTYRAHVVDFRTGHPTILADADVRVDDRSDHRLGLTSGGPAGRPRLTWSSTWSAVPHFGADPAPRPARTAKGNVITPKDGAELVEIVSVESRIRPVVVAWISNECGLCQALHPTLMRAGSGARGWVLVAGDAEALERGLAPEHLREGSPFTTDRYPTVRRFEGGRLTSEAPDDVVDHWIEKKDAHDLDRWARYDVSVVDAQSPVGAPPKPV